MKRSKKLVELLVGNLLLPATLYGVYCLAQWHKRCNIKKPEHFFSAQQITTQPIMAAQILSFPEPRQPQADIERFHQLVFPQKEAFANELERAVAAKFPRPYGVSCVTIETVALHDFLERNKDALRQWDSTLLQRFARENEGYAVAFAYVIGDQVILSPGSITPEERVYALLNYGTTAHERSLHAVIKAVHHQTALHAHRRDQPYAEKSIIRKIHLGFISPPATTQLDAYVADIPGVNNHPRNALDITLRHIFQLYGIHAIRRNTRLDCSIAEFIGRNGTTFADFSKATCNEIQNFLYLAEKEEPEEFFARHGVEYTLERAANRTAVNRYAQQRLERLLR